MLKMIGLIGLVLASGLVGMMKAADLRERIHLLEDFYKMILEMKGQINYFREPLIHIFRKTERKQDSKAFHFLENCRKDLEEKNGEIEEIWEKNISAVYKNTPLIGEDKEIFNYTGTFLGQTDYENQLQQFQYIEERLLNQIEDARQVYRQKGPMYQRVGFFAGAMAAIVFL